MTEENKMTFQATDRLGLKSFCEKLEKYLFIEHDYVDGGLVLGLNAGFGAGKTTFIKMWESDLQSRAAESKLAPLPVVLNAWETDYCGDPLTAILASLLEALNKLGNKEQADKKAALKNAAKDVAWFAVGMANEFAAKWTGVNVVSAGALATEKHEARQPEIPDFVELFQKRIDALKTLKEKLTEVFGGEAPKVIVFVDELDRCRPDYAVSYLESIKHVFDIRGMVFILAIDHQHLANSAKALFGQDLVFDEYFRKFCHRVIDLPEPNEQGFRGLTSDYVKKYLEVEGRRLSGINLSDRVKNILELAAGLQMRPRQLQEAFRITGHACSVSDLQLRGNVYWCITAMIILLSFLRTVRPDIYLKIRTEQMSHEEFGRFLSTLVDEHIAEWWFMIYLTGLSNKSAGHVDFEGVLRAVGFLQKDQKLDPQRLTGHQHGWGHFGGGIIEIVRRIESVDSF